MRESRGIGRVRVGKNRKNGKKSEKRNEGKKERNLDLRRIGKKSKKKEWEKK